MERDTDPRATIEQVARSALERYPSGERLYEGEGVQIGPVADQDVGDIQQFLEQIRGLFEAGAAASTWNDDQLGTFALVTDWIHLSFRVASLLTVREITQVQETTEAATTGRTVVFQCASERQACLDTLGCTKSSWPCQCCAPCNLAFLACIYGVLQGKRPTKTATQ